VLGEVAVEPLAGGLSWNAQFHHVQ
jgi:hypothetical protein